MGSIVSISDTLWCDFGSFIWGEWIYPLQHRVPSRKVFSNKNKCSLGSCTLELRIYPRLTYILCLYPRSTSYNECPVISRSLMLVCKWSLNSQIHQTNCNQWISYFKWLLWRYFAVRSSPSSFTLYHGLLHNICCIVWNILFPLKLGCLGYYQPLIWANYHLLEHTATCTCGIPYILQSVVRFFN